MVPLSISFNSLVMLNIHKYLIETHGRIKDWNAPSNVVSSLQCSKSFLVRYSSHSSPTNSKRNNDSARCFQLIISTQFLKVLKQLLKAFFRVFQIMYWGKELKKWFSSSCLGLMKRLIFLEYVVGKVDLWNKAAYRNEIHII